jgi:hypothetical protein
LIQCFGNHNVIVAANALDALFEIYSEESFDHIFKEKGLMNLLVMGLGTYQSKMKEFK